MYLLFLSSTDTCRGILNLVFIFRPLFLVTLPANVNPGDVIHVKNQKGQINAIVVPDGMGPGSTFTVEFDTGDAPMAEEEIAVAVPEPEISVSASQYPSAPVYQSSTQAYGR